MKKIAIFTYSIYTMGGEQKVVSMIANELSKEFDITIFTMDDSFGNSMYDLSDRVQVKFYHPYSSDCVSVLARGIVHTIPVVAYEVFPSIVKRAYCYDEYAKKMYELIGNSYDTIIATAWQLSIILGNVKANYGIRSKTIGWMHSSYEAYFQTKYLYLYKNEILFSENAKYLDDLVVLNEQYSKEYKENMGIDCKVIYNPKGLSSYLKSDMNNKNFVACGRFTSEKGFDLLIKAFAIFSNENEEWNLSIVGDGPLKKTYKKLIDKYGICDRVKFWGRMNNVLQPLLDSSIYILTSRYEGFPTCVTEAYEVGLPVISFDIPAMIPLSKNGEAILIKQYDVEEMAKQMHRLANDYSLRMKMRDNAVKMAKSLTIEEIAKKWKEIL